MMAEDAESRIADNVLLFCRTLRTAGLPVGPGQVIEAGSAILATGIERRDDFYYALRAVLVKDPSQRRIFDQAFHIWFRNPRLLERMMGLLLPTLVQIDKDGEQAAEPAARRLLEALSERAETASDDMIIEIDHEGSWSSQEVLKDKDFEQMSLDEQREAEKMLREAGQFLRDVRTRRFRSHRFGNAYDLRKTFRLMFRNSGQLIQLARKSRRVKPPTLVLLCDISGSMSRYSRMFMHFAHALGAFGQPVHTFVFGTRLTNITHWLNERDVDKALARVSEEVVDWDGGTRIADCLERFNVDWGRRVLTGHSVVLLLSDGLERDSGADLAFQAARLQRSCDDLIWLNPMLRYEKFEPRATGVKAMLPYVDRFLPAHNVSSLSALGRLLCDPDARKGRLVA